MLRLAGAAVLGATTTIGMAWALARWRTVPPYPRTTMRAFMLNGRAWNTTEVHLWGAQDIWWMDLEFDEVQAGRAHAIEQRTAMKEGHAVIHRLSKDAATLCDEARTRFVELAKQRPGSAALTSPPSWGSFTDPASLPPFDKSGNDAAFGFPVPCLWYRVLGQLKANMTLGGPVEGGILLHGLPSSRGTGLYHALPSARSGPRWRSIG